MRIMEGVEAYLYLDGKAFEPGDDGFVGNLRRGRLVTLVLEVAAERRGAVHPFIMDGAKNVSLLRERGQGVREEQYGLLDQVGSAVTSQQLADEEAETLRQEIAACASGPDEEHEGVYRMSMIIVSDRRGSAMAKYPENVLRVVEMLPGGRTVFHRVSLASDQGRFFVARDVAHDVRVYRNVKGEIVLPALHKEWPQAQSLLKGLWANRVEELADITKYVREPEPSREGLEPGTGRVLWVSEGMGIYAILTPEGTARAFRGDLYPRADSPVRRLYPGEIVGYERLEQPMRKRNITRSGYQEFRWQVHGVRVVAV